MSTEVKIDRDLARKVLELVDYGLVRGKGVQVPGQMCVEAAVCAAMGLPHSDEPPCVAPALRRIKITLNDCHWSSDKARAKGLRRLAIAQLGSRDALDEREFLWRCLDMLVRKHLPRVLRLAASKHSDQRHKDALEAAAVRCEREGSWEAINNAQVVTKNASADADADANNIAYAIAYTNADDDILGHLAEGKVQILIDMKAPGCEWLDLTEPPNFDEEKKP